MSLLGQDFSSHSLMTEEKTYNYQFERAKTFTLDHLEDLTDEILCRQYNNPNTYILFRQLDWGKEGYKAIKSQYFIDSLVTKSLDLEIIELHEITEDELVKKFRKAFDFIIKRSYQKLLDMEYTDSLQSDSLEKIS